MVYKKVCSLIAEQFSIDAETITPDTLFEENLGADSLDIVELSMALEEEFEIGEMGDEDLSSIKSVGDLVTLIQSRLGA